MTSIPVEIRIAVLTRDRFRCVAPAIDGRCGICRDIWGNPILRWSGRDPGPEYLQMSHVKPQGELATGKKAPHVPSNLVSLCPGHHTATTAGSNWEAVNRNKIRRWLEEKYHPIRTYFG